MQIDRNKRFNLYAPCFETMRMELDTTLSNILQRMRNKRMNAASVGLKIDIVTEDTTVRDANAPGGERAALLPDVSYKLSVVMQSKGESKGDVVSSRGGYELLSDGMGSFYVVSKEEASGQLSMFNTYEEYEEAQEG